MDKALVVPRRKHWLRKTLRRSQQEAVASAAMIATGDNFFNAFAIHLQATAVQMGWLGAIPQLIGGISQVLSVWLGNHLSRRNMVVMGALIQGCIVLGLVVLATDTVIQGVYWLIGLVTGYAALTHFIQPQWRAWMGSVVPARRRGAFFASRTRLAQIASLSVFLAGGIILSWAADVEKVAWGFIAIFAIAAVGRFISAALLAQMHDPDPHTGEGKGFAQSIRQCREALKDKTFKNYSFFVAGMTGMVAISAPFFAVYMLSELHFTYLQFSLNHMASIATQFIALHFWGKFCDSYGNRLVMIICACLIPCLPILWMVSPNFYYLLFVQAASGFAWSGFTLSTANYLYDIRPHRTDFAVYAAVQSALGAAAIFVGGVFGGYLASHAADILALLSLDDFFRSSIYLVFITTAVLRAGVSLWFIPRSVEPKLRRRPEMLTLVLRVARFNAISGVSFDWLTVKKKESSHSE